MFKPSNKREILKGIYQENLWVAGKGEAPAKKGAQQPERSLHKRKSHAAIVVSVAAILVVAGVLSQWQYPWAQIGLNPQPIPAGESSPASGGEAKAVPLEIGNTAGSGTNATPLPKMLQKNLSSVDNLEGSALPRLDDSDIDPAKFQSLTNNGVPLAQLFGLGVRTIVIDPGHGGKDPGAIGKSGIYEKDIALEIAKRLRKRLAKYDRYEVLMTRASDDTIALNDRVEYANANNADLFISIHINYFPSEKSFIETYYFGSTNDAKVADLAERENADSHYEYGDFKEIIQKIGDTMKFQESRQLAYSVQTNLYGRMKQINGDTNDHGIKSAPFVVLLNLDAPSILTEVSCFCNPREEKRLTTSEYRENIAAFLEQGIVSYLNKNTSVGGKRNGEKEKLAKAQQ
ncbi:MAG: N-acetylmuramoyl-L-alanine amidase [Gammaproteobacteria bacterium]